MRKFNEFGTDVPYIEIGAPAHPPKPQDDSPGPGQYSNRPQSIGERLKINHQIRARPPTDYRTLTGKVRFIPQPNLLEDTPKVSIHHSDRDIFRVRVLTPPSEYTSKWDVKPLTIGPKIEPLKPDPVPGPGKYDINDNRVIPFSLILPSPPRILFPIKNEGPEPGTYNVTQMPGPPKRWTLRLRPRTSNFTRKTIAEEVEEMKHGNKLSKKNQFKSQDEVNTFHT